MGAQQLTAVVTGAGSGIGRAVATALGERGLRVCCIGRRLEQIKETARQIGAGTVAIPADVGTESGINLVTHELGDASISALIHAAAIEGILGLSEIDRAYFDRLVATNLAGPLFLTKALRPRLIQGSGIVFVGSVSALHGRTRHAAYAATKAGLLGLTTSLAVELAPDVRVNCVAPGATNTPMFAEAVAKYFESMDPNEAQMVQMAEANRVLLNRIADPAEIAVTIVHLALDASYTTGAVIAVDGGFSAR
jgi:NAD(P)-dependent dehydrogenase (short-subunit alcohol dehydrogenase family)